MENNCNSLTHDPSGGALDSCLERFECQREDEILFTNPEFVDGIPPFACKFAEQPSISHLLAAADEDGRVFIYNTNLTGPTAQVQGKHPPRNCQCVRD